jgi:hypothetical protein
MSHLQQLILPVNDCRLTGQVERCCGFEFVSFFSFFAVKNRLPWRMRPWRQQLAVFKRNVPQPKLNNRDRLFWIGLYMIWQDWKCALMIVQPETVTAGIASASDGIGGSYRDLNNLVVRESAPRSES